MAQKAFDIRVSLSQNFNYDEHKEAEKLFANFGTVDVKEHLRAAADPLTLFAIVIVTFTVGSFANGYFSKMGEDAYDLSKKGLASLVTRIRKPVNRATVLEFVFPFDGLDVHAFLETRSREGAEYALANSSEMVALLDAAKSANTLPAANQIEFQYDEEAKHWKFNMAMYFSLDVRIKFRFNDSNGSWEKLG